MSTLPNDDLRIVEGEPPTPDFEALRTKIRRELAEELYERHSGTCGCGCTCAFYVDPDCERVTK